MNISLIVAIKDYLPARFVEFWNMELFHIGSNPISLNVLFFLALSTFLLFFLTGKLKYLLLKKIFPRYNLEPSVSTSIATMTRYVLVIIGFVIILQTSGINLSALGILFGALGVGIGFGLQNITSNFISGIIILFEKPVKVGDRVEVNEIVGNIVKISARSTTIINNDNIAVVVPNSNFIDNVVINWSLNDRNVRFNFPVGVSYNEDPQKIKKILLDVARNNPGVLKDPEPDVLFDEYGDSSINFILRIWTQEYSDRPMVLKSQLYYTIFDKLKEHGVEIPFPQRDVHFKSGSPVLPS